MTTINVNFNDITTADINEDSNLISNVQPTCYSGICKNEQYSGWVLSPEERNVNLEEDKRILLAIKEDNEQVFKDLITEQKYLKGLSVGYPGNSLLHETIYYNSPKIFEYILKERGDNVEYLEKKIKMEIPLNLACLKSN